MLQAAGISAAMRNAEDDVKQAAKFVAGNNEEDGAAHFLEVGFCKKNKIWQTKQPVDLTSGLFLLSYFFNYS